MSQDNQELLSIYNAGIDNNDYVTASTSTNGSMKHFVLILRLLCKILISKHRILDGSAQDIKLLWQPLHKIVLGNINGEVLSILNHKSINSNHKLYQYFTVIDVLKFIIRKPACAKKNTSSGGWLTFQMINTLISSQYVKQIYIAGHYDVLASWISLLAHKYGKGLTISQHGVCAGIDLPHKLPVSRLYSFSEPEAEMFKRFILNPEGTKVIIKGFKSSVHFEDGDFKKPAIAIASQPGYEGLVRDVAERVVSSKVKYDIIIYPHPLDKLNTQDFIECNGIKIYLSKVKHSNIELLIVFNSTLAYDYLACPDFIGEIVCYYSPLDKTDLAIYHDPRIRLIRPEEFQAYLITGLSK